MGQTLTHGIYLPDEGERNCYSGLAANWQLLDGAVGTVAEHTSQIAGKAPAVHTHTKADITDFPAYGNTAGTICEGNDSRLSDARTPVAHTHVTADVTDLLNGNHTWTGDNTFSQAVGFTKVNATTLYGQNSRAELGDSGLSGDPYNQIAFWDKNGDNFSYLRQTYNADGTNVLNIIVRNKFLNGVPNTAGTIDYAYFGIILGANKSKEAVFKANLRPYDSTNAYNLGDATYQWNNLYAKNYYYNGTAWGLDKANTWSKLQTISYTGSNVQFALKHTETDISSSPTRNNWLYLNFYDVNSVSVGGYNYSKKTNGNARLYLNLRTKNTNNDIVEKNIHFETNQEGTNWNLYPSSDADISLGISGNRWKTLNGVNPGALSLPDYSDPDPINFSQWSVPGNSNNYTPTEDGWLCIIMKDAATTSIFIYTSGITMGKQYAGSVYGNGTQGSGRLALMIPVRANVQYTAILRGDSVSDIYAVIFYPCLGNV